MSAICASPASQLVEAIANLRKQFPAGDPKHVSGLADLRKQFPAADWQLIDALYDLRNQVLKVAKDVSLEPEPLTPHELRKAVENRMYELAYWHYDFPNDLFDLGGLIDPKASGHGSRNFMNLRRSGRADGLDNLLTQAQTHRDFDTVRKALQNVHKAFRTSMPFVPLWTLDAHIVLDAKLTTVPAPSLLDPLAVFTHADEWRFGP